MSTHTHTALKYLILSNSVGGHVLNEGIVGCVAGIYATCIYKQIDLLKINFLVVLVQFSNKYKKKTEKKIKINVNMCVIKMNKHEKGSLKKLCFFIFFFCKK